MCPPAADTRLRAWEGQPAFSPTALFLSSLRRERPRSDPRSTSGHGRIRRSPGRGATTNRAVKTPEWGRFDGVRTFDPGDGGAAVCGVAALSPLEGVWG